MSNRPLLVMVGGFLGAGKTSLILSAAAKLQRRLRNNAILSLARSALSTGGIFSAGLAGGGVSGAACGIGML